MRWPDTFDHQKIFDIESRSLSDEDRRPGAPQVTQVNGCNSNATYSNLHDLDNLIDTSRKVSVDKMEEGGYLNSGFPNRNAEGVVSPQTVFITGLHSLIPVGRV